MRTVYLGLFLAFMGLAADALAVAPRASASDARVLVLGCISDDPKTHYERLKPLLDYVVPRMRDVGITEGRVLMARDTQQMTSYLRRGRVDWVTETSGTGMQLQARAGAKPIAIAERGGASSNRSMFFVRTDSGIDTLADLRGRSIAFQNSASTSAYFMPAAAMMQQGLQMEMLPSPDDRPTADAAGYVFARSELNIAAWVHKKLVDAGVVGVLDWDDPERLPPALRRDLKVIHSTPEYPRAVEMVRADLQPAVEARLRQVLLEAADDPDGRAALAAFFRTTRFLPLDDEAQRGLDQVREAVVRVREQME
ncbi:MAG TPA: phosphate/phosphite/phosphonate ABC transporter substrate-binding protein [Pseudoxanthomonas sp.]|nr:phosphate/phosphite/phosphonate ABC transporter substrate-binding protein [Pseudoxanthomonas sp.]